MAIQTRLLFHAQIQIRKVGCTACVKAGKGHGV